MLLVDKFQDLNEDILKRINFKKCSSLVFIQYYKHGGSTASCSGWLTNTVDCYCYCCVNT